MMAKKNQGGFTLVELLVTISVGAIVALAATSILLMGMRINRQSVDTVTRQNTTRVLLSAMEDLASDGSIKEIRSDPGQWSIKGDEGRVLFSYDSEAQTIYTGNAPLLEGVRNSVITLDSNNVLNIYVETDEGGYNSAVFCRMLPKETPTLAPEDQEEVQDIVDKNDTLTSEIPNAAERKAFLNLLASQYRLGNGAPNPGLILGGDNSGNYYSKWYITDNFTKNENWGQNGWNENTPWCACFISWAIYERRADLNYVEPDEDATNNFLRNERPSYADVDSFISYFYLKNEADKVSWITSKFWETDETKAAENLDTVYPGDIIFFDWIINEKRNPQHVGVVLYVDEENGLVFTIEGNTSNMVGVRQYKIDDPRILGYGVLDWKTAEVTE